MRRTWRYVTALAVGAVVVTATAGAAVGGEGASTSDGGTLPRPLRVLVTNDDGIAAAGIDAVVEALEGLADVDVTVVAPATNQSGTSDNFTTTAITVTETTTASGHAARSVSGFPADTVLWALNGGLAERPDLVVSGINFGQNIGDVVPLSGTIGAARTAARLGVPAVAVSQGIAGTVDYTDAANLTAAFVAFFASALVEPLAGPARVLNLNMPTCASGEPRGGAFVPVGRSTQVTGYTPTGGTPPSQTFQPVLEQRSAVVSNCLSTDPVGVDDIDAFADGFWTLSILNPDFTDR